jgi:MFS family permease
LLRVNPRFSRLGLAMLVSSIGDPLTLATSLVLIFSATGSALAVGAAYASRTAAALTVGALAGRLTDRADRRHLILSIDIARAALVLTMPFATRLSVFAVYGYLLVLGGAEALVQPARLAAVPGLVGRERIEVANSLLITAVSLAQVLGFAIAGALLALLTDPRPLYWFDALSYGLSAALVASLPSLGGRVTGPGLGGARRALQLPGVTSLLALAGGANLFVGIGTAAILPIAYFLSSRGAVAFTALEVALIAGIVGGSLLAARIPSAAAPLAMVASLWLFSAASIAVAVAPVLAAALVAISATGVGNAVCVVTNRSALMHAAGEQRQGMVMSARYAIGQTAQVVGLGCGAVMIGVLGPRWAFALVGLGLAVVGFLPLKDSFRSRPPPAARPQRGGR